MPFLPEALLTAVSVLLKPDGVIAFATDTVYGLACLPQHPQAIARIYQIKGRDETKPLILMSHDSAELFRFTGEMTPSQQDAFQALTGQYWPGSLTLVVPKNTNQVPESLTRGMQTVGLRVPDVSALHELFARIPGHVLATTSANRSGQPDCLTADAVLKALGNEIDALLIDDTVVTGQPSTVVQIHPDASRSVLRQGRLVLD